jgi:hypothetical protein
MKSIRSHLLLAALLGAALTMQLHAETSAFTYQGLLSENGVPVDGTNDFAIQSPGAPTLTIVAAEAGQAQISWAPSTPGFVLQETLSLSPANWANSPSGATNPVVVPAVVPTKFYRLFKP